jgi:hypothetical protein
MNMSGIRPTARMTQRDRWPYLPDMTMKEYAEILRKELPDAGTIQRVDQGLTHVADLFWPATYETYKRSFSTYNFFNTIHENPDLVDDIKERTVDIGAKRKGTDSQREMAKMEDDFDEIVILEKRLVNMHPKPWTGYSEEEYGSLQEDINKIEPKIGSLMHSIIGDDYTGDDIMRLGYWPHECTSTTIWLQDILSQFGIESEMKRGYYPSKKAYIDNEGTRHSQIVVYHPEIGRRFKYDPKWQKHFLFDDFNGIEKEALVFAFTMNPDGFYLHPFRRNKDKSIRQYADVETIRSTIGTLT